MDPRFQERLKIQRVESRKDAVVLGLPITQLRPAQGSRGPSGQENAQAAQPRTVLIGKAIKNGSRLFEFRPTV